MTMPPSATKKRRNVDDASAPAAKAPFGGVRRSAAAPSGTSDGGPSLLSAKSTLASATRGRAARQRQYLDGMASLNYALYRWAKAQLETGSIADEGYYFGVVENYARRQQELERKFHRAYGDIVTFGDGDCGQLGCGEAVTEARKPRIVRTLRGKGIDEVASGGLHSLALTSEGKVYSWGCNDEGSLGWQATEEKEDGAIPDRVRGFYPSQYGPNGVTKDLLDANGQLLPFEKRTEAVIAQVAAGETQSVALSTAGDVYMWGTVKDNEGRKFRNMPPKDDTRKATGYKDMNSLEDDEPEAWYHPPRGNQDYPAHVVELAQKAKDISAGGAFCTALLEDGTLATWGLGTCGELARPVVELRKTTPDAEVLEHFLKPKPPVWEQPRLKRSVVAVSCGGYHILAIAKENGSQSVYSSGLNQYGQLGHGDTENREVMTKIQFFEDKNIATIEGGLQFSCFVDETGKELYACGRGDYGQLGITVEQPDPGYLEATPCRVPLEYQPKGSVSKPKENCIDEDAIDEYAQPEIEQVSCGSTHVLVLTKGGDAYSWGFGTSGACGQRKEHDDILMPRKLEAKVKDGSKYTMRYVSGGGQHSAAIVTTGSKGFAS